MPAEEHGEAGDHEPDFIVLEVGAGPRAEGGDAARLKRCEVRAAVVVPHAVQEQSHLAVVLDDRVPLEELDKVGEALGLVARVASPDADDRRVVRMPAVRIGLDGLVEAEGHAVRVGPVGRGHPAVVALDDGAVGAVVGREPNHGTRREAARELEDVPNGRATEAVQALVLIADDAKVAGLLGELEQELLLDVVRVLVLVHQHVTDLARERAAMLGL